MAEKRREFSKNDLGNISIRPTITETFADGTVLLTGATGFLGKLTLEKLLRSCPGIRKIYIIVRSKKGKDEFQRRKEIFENEIFEPLKRKTKEIFEDKVLVLQGDLVLPNLGLSEEDQRMLIEEVNFVFHLAATVRFDEKIKIATNINIKSTRDILRMARKMKQLRSFVYISTAYSFCPLSEIEEKFYKPRYEPDKFINMIDAIEDDMQELITPKLLGQWPNTYVFTKSIAEEVVRRESEGLPLAVVRPSIVMSTYREPLTGWIDNVYGATGVLVGSGLGLIRTMWVKLNNVADLVPADFVVNCSIAAAWDAVYNSSGNDGKGKEIKIYNYVSRPENPLKWAEMCSNSEAVAPHAASKMCVWYCSFWDAESETKYEILAFLLHTVPAHIVDFVARILGKQPQLVAGYKRISKFLDVIHFFSTREWHFHNDNTKNLWLKLNPQDKEVFQFNMKSLKWKDFFYGCIRGARVYLVKDPLDTLDEGLVHYRKLKILHYTVTSILTIVALYLVYVFLKFIFNFI